MIKNKLFIPSKIRVGFQKRSDTFTGKLAYIIYYDEKGKIRKETSWNSWRDSTIEAVEYDNEPRGNYVINKGGHNRTDWGSDRVFVRIHDPRDFEFEISVPNLIGILMHSDVSKRDIAEKCVLAWDDKKLLLLPVNSEDYKESVKYTEKQGIKFSAKSLVPGIIYAQKKADGQLTYIGYYPYWTNEKYDFGKQKERGKSHVFFDGTDFVTPAPTTLSHAVTDEVSEDFAGLVEKFFHSIHAGKIISARVDPVGIVGLSTIYGHVERSAYKITGPNKLLCISNLDRRYYDTKHALAYFTFREYEMFTNGKEHGFEDIAETRREAYYKKNGSGYSNYYYHNQDFNDHTKDYKLELLNELRRIDPDVVPEDISYGTLETALKNLGYGKVLFTNDLGTEFIYKGDA